MYICSYNKISIWSPINQQDFCLSGVFYTGKELKGSAPNLSLLPLKDICPQKKSIRFQTLHHDQDQRAVQGYQGQDCRRTQGWNVYHRQAAWWESDNSCRDYSQMKETQNNCQSPSVWCYMQDLEFHWSWERWGIGPELHGRILSMISRQLGP